MQLTFAFGKSAGHLEKTVDGDDNAGKRYNAEGHVIHVLKILRDLLHFDCC